VIGTLINANAIDRLRAFQKTIVSWITLMGYALLACLLWNTTRGLTRRKFALNRFQPLTRQLGTKRNEPYPPPEPRTVVPRPGHFLSSSVRFSAERQRTQTPLN